LHRPYSSCRPIIVRLAADLVEAMGVVAVVTAAVAVVTAVVAVVTAVVAACPMEGAVVRPFVAVLRSALLRTVEAPIMVERGIAAVITAGPIVAAITTAMADTGTGTDDMATPTDTLAAATI